MPSAADCHPPRWVLDTNVVLDWLVFADPTMLELAGAIERGRVRWLYSAAMLDEALDVVGRPEFAARGEAATLRERLLARYHSHGQICDAVSQPVLRCRDPDDQMFIDLALQHRAALLLSRDKALLQLARAAAGRGLRIATPAAARQVAD